MITRFLQIACLPVFLCLAPAATAQETILQYFNTSWKEIERRIPEVAEAGYTSLWLPQPAKGASGGFSVGYDPLDRFDLGDRNQAGTVATRYGTRGDLLRLVEKAHRFGLRIYFDNVMAHNAGPLDNVPPGTLFPGVPGFVPEDFHLVRREGGGWRKASDSINYNDEWQVLNRNPFAWDIAQENPNISFDPIGQQEGITYPKWIGVRHPNRPELYPDTDLPAVTDANGVAFHHFSNKEPFLDQGYSDGNSPASPTNLPDGYLVYSGGGAVSGAGNGRFDFKDLNGNGQHDPGEPCEPFQDSGVDPSNPNYQTSAWGFGDGKYNMGNPVPEDVNGMLIRSIQWTIDQTHCDGFRLDAVKHVPSYFFGQQGGSQAEKDRSSSGYMGRAQAQFNLTHGYSDWSNYRDANFSTSIPRNDLMMFGEHLGAPPNPNDYLSSGMRVANDDFLNQVGGFGGIGSSLVDYDQPGRFTFGVHGGMMYCLSHDNNYMAGSERPAAHQYMLTRAGVPIVYTDGYNISGPPDYFPKPAYIPFLGQYGQTYITGSLPVRRDFMRGDQWPRWNSQNVAGWEFRDYSENPSMPDGDAVTLVVMHARNYAGGQQMPFGTAFPAGHRLRNHSPYGGAFFASVGGDGRLRPDGSLDPVVIPPGGYFAFSYDTPALPSVWQGAPERAPIEIYENGQRAAFIGVRRIDGRNGDPAYAHTVQVPVVRNGSNLRFLARADGSAANMLMKLDGGIDLNSQMGLGSTNPQDRRDNKPGSATDTFLGYEQMRFVHRVVEKFAAQNVARNVIGSPGAETWQCTIGAANFARNNGGGVNFDTDAAVWAYHDPEATGIGTTSNPQFFPAPENAAGQSVTVWVKVGYQAQGMARAWLYYTTDGTSFPEGSAGLGRGSTRVVALALDHVAASDGTGLPEWWKGTLPALPAGTVLRYKIGVHRLDAADRLPYSAEDVSRKNRMETVFEVAHFDATSAVVFPHNNLGKRHAGLREGFHVLRSRAFLSRSGKTSIFRTQTQTFYYDTRRPEGMVLFPNENSTIGGSTYGFVVLTDDSVTGVSFNILDSNPGNDSAENGNGSGNWAPASEAAPSQLGATGFTREWRFDYRNIPSSGAAVVQVRLREASSSTDDSLSDPAGWFTTLTRTINTGFPVNYRIEFPSADGAVVDSSFVAKVYFDKSLGFIGGNPVASQQMIDEFTVTIDGVLLPRSAYAFIRDETATESALAFHFPNLFDGNPDRLHETRAVHERGDIALTDARLVKAAPGAIVDSDGDGLPDYWEFQNLLDANNPDGDEGAYGDKDFDGIPNILEYLYDLAPLDPSDGLQPLTPVIARSGATWKLTFRVIPHRRYQVEASSDFGEWTALGPSFTVPTANPLHEWFDPAPSSEQRFYRVRISLP
jgi:glycosidase